MECLCPKCGFLWENEDIAPSDELKEAVRLHLEGRFDSVVGAMVSGPRFQSKMKKAQAVCDPQDLRRFEIQKLYEGPIERGMIFVWGPFNPFAAEVVKIVDIRDGEFATISAGDPRTYWNTEQTVREQLVISILKAFPSKGLV